MKNVLRALFVTVCMGLSASATIVQYTLTPTANANEYTTLFTTDAVLGQNQAIVVRFPYSSTPPSFTTLSNPIGGVGYNLFVHQPNNPSGANGDLTIIRSAAGSGGVGNFSIDGVYIGGAFPSTLPWEIYQFDGSGSGANVVGGILSSGNAVSGVPEPSSALLSLVGAAMAGYWVRRRRA
jgi:hypothetical protein